MAQTGLGSHCLAQNAGVFIKRFGRGGFVVAIKGGEPNYRSVQSPIDIHRGDRNQIETFIVNRLKFGGHDSTNQLADSAGPGSGSGTRRCPTTTSDPPAPASHRSSYRGCARFGDYRTSR